MQVHRIIHKSDYTMLHEGSVVISSSYRKIRNIVSHIEEHHFEVLKVKHADGRIESMFLPMKDDSRAGICNEIVPGTSITANMLSYLTFNRFQMSTPAYRRSILQELLLQAAQRIKKGKDGLRKPSSHDNMQIIIV